MQVWKGPVRSLTLNAAALTVRWLSRTNAVDEQALGPRWIVCTGERMERLILKLYPGIKTTTYQPRHAQDRLSNDFRCYANFESGLWKMQQYNGDVGSRIAK